MKKKVEPKKTRVSAKSKLLEVYSRLEAATVLQQELQTKMFEAGKPKELLHDLAMVGHFMALARDSVVKALK